MTENLTFIDYLRSILGILLFIGLFSLLIPIVSVLVVISLGKLTDWILEKVAPFLSRIVLRVLGITFRTEYHQTKLEDDSILTGNVQTPAIYIVNHASTLDILTILALGIKRVRFVAKWEMQYFPFFFLLGRLTGQIFIKRGNREKAIQTLQNNYAKVHRYRRSILIAPEGTRKHEMPIGSFKKGAFRMALDLGYPIVPVYFKDNISHNLKLFAGPKIVSVIEQYMDEYGVQEFDRSVDFGWFYFLTKPIFHVLEFIFGYVGNFGWAIIIFTLLMRICFFPLAQASFKSMAKMKKLGPELQRLKEQYGDDRAGMQKEMMALYKREKANPIAGCLPILLQIPVFFALYKVLFVTIEMRHAPFIGWIHDLSAPDPLGLLTLFGFVDWSVP